MASTAIHGALAGSGVDDAALSELDAIQDSGLPLILSLPGIVFPLAIVVSAVVLWRQRAVPAPIGVMLAVAGIGYPIGRIPQLDVLFYIVDILFIVSLGWIGLRLLSPFTREAATPAAAPTS